MTVQKRERGGKVRWVGRYRGPDGTERSRTFDTKGAAKDWVDEREREKRRGEWVDPAAQSIHLSALWQKWVTLTHVAGTRKVRELVGANLGRLEKAPIVSILTSDVTAWVTTLREGRPWVDGCDGLAENTVNSWFGQLSGCLQMAVDDGLLLRNPCAPVKVRADRKEEVDEDDLLTVAQVWALVDTAVGRRQVTLSRMIITAAGTGLRPGELAGLRVRSVDFLRREARIAEQATTGAAFEWARLKTKRSRRHLPLPDEPIAAMTAELADRPTSRDMPVFRTAKDGMWSSSTIAHAFRALRAHAGLDERFTFHSLRHFYASGLIHSGASPKVVSERLGHSSVDTTMGVYAKLWPGEDERTREAINALLVRGASTVRDQRGTGGLGTAQ